MKLNIFKIIILITIISCNKEKQHCADYNLTSLENCIDTSAINTNNMCFDLWEPVCGCNNITYSNDCYATISGVTSYTPGECCND